MVESKGKGSAVIQKDYANIIITIQ